MTAAINATITAGEAQSLRDVAKRLMQPVIPAAHKTRLLHLGYIKQALGGLMLTDAGEMRLAIDDGLRTGPGVNRQMPPPR